MTHRAVRVSHQRLFQVSALVALAGPHSRVPTFAFNDESWVAQALCAQTDPDAFFPEMGASPKVGKRVCVGCDVRGECLEYALKHDEQFGIWGGLTVRERRRLARPQGAPIPIVNNRKRTAAIPCPVPMCPDFFATELGVQRHVRRSLLHAKRAS